MLEITADYVSGAGAETPSPAEGRLRMGADGLAFTGRTVPDKTLAGREVAFGYEAGELRGASLGSADELRRLSSGVLGYFWLGPLGGIVGMGSPRSSGLLVAVERAGRPSLLTFAVGPDDGAWLMAQMPEERARNGLAALPTVEELAGPPPQERLLTEIRDLVAAQGAVLARIARSLERDRTG